MRIWALLAVCLASRNVAGLQITSISADKGTDEKRPVSEDDTFTIRCDISTNSDQDDWVSCSFSHELYNVKDDGDPIDLSCSAGDYSTDNGKTCTNQGGSDILDNTQYVSRIQMYVSKSYCGLVIRGSDPRDTGKWACHVVPGPLSQESTKVSEIEIYAANQSTIIFSEPNQWEDDSVTITYDMEASRREIEATCRAYGGYPEPEFTWYVEDDRHEIDDPDVRKRTGTDAIYGDYVEETISFSPDMEAFCDEYDLDDCTESSLSFNLMCKVTQGDSGEYFSTENDNQEAKIVVDVLNNSASTLTASVFLLIIIARIFV